MISQSRPISRLALIVLALGTVPPGQAQETHGAILGRVADSSGGAISVAQVRAVYIATGVEVTTTTNESGNYVLPYLLPGTYTLQTQGSGFKKSIREGIERRINDRVELNIELEVGQVSEQIEVRADTPLLDTATS